MFNRKTEPKKFTAMMLSGMFVTEEKAYLGKATNQKSIFITAILGKSFLKS